MRELKAVVELAAVLAEDDLIRSPDLSLRGPAPAASNGPPRTLHEETTRLVQESASTRWAATYWPRPTAWGWANPPFTA